MTNTFQIRYIGEQNLQDFIAGKYSEDAFVMILYYHNIIVRGLDHIDVTKNQVKVHHRNIPGGFIIRGAENFDEYDYETILDF